ncbi:MAG: ParB/RepB/Spo0J family partition protein, partial [Oscillospiraceae bacterium]|nr:ParB/RepB/Spo0J family partition protein [Oscillospiraceae bacterium]
MAVKRGGLGMGLGALFDDNSSDIQVKKTLRVSEIEPNRLQPRKNFNEEAIASLAESVKEHGIIQPLLVRPYNNSYQIVAGERRWRAAKMLAMEEIPVIIKELSDAEAMQLALIENLQREDLNPIEEASGYKELVETYNMKQEELGKLFGKSRSSVSNLMRLLNLPEEVQEYLKEGLVTVGHAKILLGVEDKVILMELADRVAQGRLTVRQLEV